jgi:hypothetical protein
VGELDAVAEGPAGSYNGILKGNGPDPDSEVHRRGPLRKSCQLGRSHSGESITSVKASWREGGPLLRGVAASAVELALKTNPFEVTSSIQGFSHNSWRVEHLSLKAPAEQEIVAATSSPRVLAFFLRHGICAGDSQLGKAQA